MLFFSFMGEISIQIRPGGKPSQNAPETAEHRSVIVTSLVKQTAGDPTLTDGGMASALSDSDSSDSHTSDTGLYFSQI